MRLKHIKLAGFKSFVDPTKVAFPDPMTAIVGPNGCGKSNVIDAVRWVLGESNAKNLRGDAMTDVIFNGSTARKAVSLASVELEFDNSDGRLEGQFASYAEISVKRQVNREAQSSYFLNGSKCRRRDITDLFMGTGLGPRSYAIIEQGTVSRLIESKPQELRVFIEEAAGISRYKERRRETENRIRHTRENLERLADIRNELASQIEKLEQQAQAAKRYRLLKGEERTLTGELIALRWREADRKMARLATQIQQQQQRLTALQDSLSGDDAVQLQLQQQKTELSGNAQTSQQQRFALGTEITKIEQQQLHAKARQQQVESEQRRNQQQLSDAQQQQQDLQRAQQALEGSLQQANPMLTLLGDTAATIKQQYQQLEQQHDTAEQQRELCQQQQQQADKLLHEISSELAANRREQQQKQEQQQQSEQQLQQLLLPQLQDSLTQAQQQSDGADGEHHAAQQRLQQAELAHQAMVLQLTQTRQQQQQVKDQLTEQQAQQQALQTLIAARQTELPAELASLPRLWQQLQVVPHWAGAVERVLGERLQGVIAAEPLALPQGAWQFQLEPGTASTPAANSSRTWPSLAQQVASPCNLAPWLSHVYCAADPAQQQQWLSDCQPHESVILANGDWRGNGFVGRAGSATELPLTQLQLQLQQLMAQQQQNQQALQHINAEQASAADAHAAAETMLQQRQQQLQQAREWQLQQHNQIEKWQHQLTLAQQQQALLQQQTAQAQQELQQLQQQQQQLQQRQQQAQQGLQQHQQELNQRQQQLLQLRQDLKQQRQQLDDVASKVQQSQLQQQSDKARLAGIADQLSQAHHNVQQWQQRLHDGEQQLQQLLAPLQPQQQQLQQFMAQRAELEQQQQQQQQQLAQLEGRLAAINDSARGQQGQRDKIQQQKLKLELEHEGWRVKAQGQLDLLAESQLQLQPLLDGLDSAVQLPQRQAQLNQVKASIERLGPINLAAIDEFEQQHQRKQYLDQQDNDLSKALEMLEGAIRKIDRETKARFKTTFDAINADLITLFPKVFGGGSASLELTGDDLLEAGVTIMAQPPGKKNSTIHLLSGGEKALTALSLVFAIFRLNPAPFCLLDEVDAPLDDANVGRFCRLVKEMSETVQFIFISHNKISMEMADRLTGVTMAEPGCSRIVAVDIEAAAALAQIE
ncbi:chromosome segregation protein SMC [uncultured Ferrimonas sp.]|uniref:chromosome segregation protein SMC n=1 Tax=uncultured Ferrimonas sp. TaxID=432640 RepID=UPI0026137F0F|nr:chromosome segregation protein SMC [uncultured Ferrimonas sp.]